MPSHTVQRSGAGETRTSLVEAQADAANQHGLLHGPEVVLPPTPPKTIEKLTRMQTVMMAGEQVSVFTEHVIHAGMYSRTITLPAGVDLIGALIKIPTLVIVVGRTKVLMGEETVVVEGYAVLRASAYRKQQFQSIGPVIITMIFPTKARTVEEAEREFTDEYEILLSHRQDLNAVTITGENE